ncbi:MAG: DUF1365 domain-containing protein [Leptospiraceae bacterium]|nr:DUF1365 domain-containing protein [Leptospiraceae bacterium]
MIEGIYETRIWHSRQRPVAQYFQVQGYMLLVDVARFDAEDFPSRLLGFRKARWHHFRRDDFTLIADTKKSAVDCAREFLFQHAGVRADQFFLLAHPAVAGYNFNPVSFFFCLRQGKHVATIVEVNNTFYEQKHYIVPAHNSQVRFKKHFYVSPFISPLDDFIMQIPLPNETLDIRIDTLQGNSPELLAGLSGKRYPLCDRWLLWFAIKYPFHTLRVITLIHYYALKLFLRKVPYFRKKSADAAIVHSLLMRSSR